MQNKGVIRLFAIIFSLVCLGELSYTFVANGVASDAREYANGDADREQDYLDSMLNVEVIDLGTEALTWTYAEVKEREINLGLDLRGGMNVILEVSVRDILLNLAGDPNDPMLRQALANSDEGSANSDEAYIDIFYREMDALIAADGGTRNYNEPTLFGTQRTNERLGDFNATEEELKDFIRSEVNEAVSQVYTVLKARIDQFGIVQPNVQRLEGTGRILVELPGVKDPERVKEVIITTAELKFWGAFKGYEVLPYLDDVNTLLRDIVPNPNETEEGTTDEQSESTDEDQSSDFNVDEFLTTAETDSTESDSADSTAVAGDETDSTATDRQFNPLYELFYPSVNQDGTQYVQGPSIGFIRPSDTAKFMEYLNMARVRSMRPANLRYAKIVFGRPDPNTGVLTIYALQGNRDNEAPLEGDVVTDARQDYEAGRAVVTLAMNATGANKWSDLTRELSQQQDMFDTEEFQGGQENPGFRGYIAITLDDVVYSAPSVDKEIPGGRTTISGQFTAQEAQDLATVLKAGKLPVPTRIVQSDIIGPTLGREAINASLNSFLIAFIVVMIYMVLYYNFAGVVADISLLVNMLFVFGFIASNSIVLTLPGMAGIVLTIGMAVDANVIIYERIREELANGKDTRLAIRDGYKHSYSAIIDANLTTLLTAIALFIFGTGPIAGFATTLMVGIVASVFTAIFITRLVFEWRLKRKENVTFSTKISRGLLKNTNIDFIGKRKTAYVISGILIVASIASLSTKGLNYGVDFLGGRSYTVRFDQPVDVQDIANSLAGQFVDDEGNSFQPTVKTLGDASQVVITTEYLVAETGTEIDERIQSELFAGVSQFFANEIDEESFMAQDDQEAIGLVASRQVGPTIADDIGRNAVFAVIFSLIAIFVYILARFSKPQYSLGAIAAIVHDVIIVFGIFSIFDGILPFQLEVDQAFVAAILTVIGYSLNDTVVVFDRVREYFSHYHKKRSMSSILNSAMNGTLSRTLNTSITTLVVLLIILIFGGESVRGFIFAITVGVVIGTYSSLFVATPAVYDTTKDKNEDAE